MQGIPDIEPFKRRFEELAAQIAAPDFYKDNRRAARISREHQKLGRVLELFQQLQKNEKEACHRSLLSSAQGAYPSLLALCAPTLARLRYDFVEGHGSCPHPVHRVCGGRGATRAPTPRPEDEARAVFFR